MNAAARLWNLGKVYAALPCSLMSRIRVLPDHPCEQSASEFGMGVQRKLLAVHPNNAAFGGILHFRAPLLSIFLLRPSAVRSAAARYPLTIPASLEKMIEPMSSPFDI